MLRLDAMVVPALILPPPDAPQVVAQTRIILG